MKNFIFILSLFFTMQCVYALEVVYPKKTDVSIASPSTFFVGSSNFKKELTINGEVVPVHHSGGFAWSVPLTVGVNTFTLKSGNDTLVYKITRPAVSSGKENSSATLVEYDNMKYAEVSEENAPLRSTPVDSGINRIAHLQKGIPLVIDGEKNGFYRVILGAKKEGWISKPNVSMKTSGTSLARFSGYDYIDTDDFFIFVFHLSKQTPWELVEGEPFLIKIYNVEDQPDNTYIMNFSLHRTPGGKKLLGYSARFSGSDFIVKIRKPVIADSKKPLKNIVIAVDAGHGGSESGAAGCLGNLEKDVNLEFAKYLESELKSRGANVVMIRNSDTFIGLNERVESANEAESLIFISIHGNSLPDSQNPLKNNGTEIYYYYKQAKPLAEWIMNSMVLNLGVKNHGVRQQSLAVVRNTSALSILIEVGYLINPEDNARMINKDFQKKTAKAIADGIENFITRY